MTQPLHRRDFLATSAAVSAGLVLAGRLPAAEYRTKLKKALIGKPDQETLKSWKDAGFDGIESSDRKVSVEDAAAARKAADKLGMRIHALLFGWANFNSPDTSKVAEDVAAVEASLKAAGAYGADAVLLVPCKVGSMPMPEAWEFEIEFDEKTGMVQKVAAGDNAKYKEYIEAQNHATKASRAIVEKLIPVAEKARVVIALENVWNNLWVKPTLFRNFVASFDSPWVQAYFDIGNHVKYAPAEDWIRTLGKLIVKCHVKDFLLNSDGHGGKFVDIRDGSVNWPVVRQALEDVGYSGFMTIEGSGGLSLEEKSKRLDLIFAGK
ncbi:MAG: TIM barrel protein [Pirellulales bacterium]|nr:TIM barrel protein [Pirellulales bacterium]